MAVDTRTLSGGRRRPAARLEGVRRHADRPIPGSPESRAATLRAESRPRVAHCGSSGVVVDLVDHCNTISYDNEERWLENVFC